MPAVSLWPSDACLITELASELATLADDELRHAEIVLPTKRLGNWLLALIAKQRHAFLPPRLYNFDTFVTQHALRWGVNHSGDDLKLAGDLEQELLLAGLLKESSYKHLHLGHEHEIKQLFAEFIEWELGSEVFAALRTCIEQDIIRSHITIDTLSERVNELEHLFTQMQIRLTALGYETAPTRSARQSHAFAKALEEGRVAFAGRVYLVGFTSISGMHRRLLGALSQHPAVDLWLSRPPKLFGDRNPLALLLQALDAPILERTPRHRPATSGLTKRVDVYAAPTVLDETAEALKLAQSAIDAGYPPSLIAILVTDDSTYGKAIRTLLRGTGIEANLAISTPLASTPLGACLSAMLEVTKHGGISALLALLSHPLMLRWWQHQKDCSSGHSDRSSAAPTAELPSNASAALREQLARDLCLVSPGTPIASLATGATRSKLSPEVRDYVASAWQLLQPLSPLAGSTPRPLAEWTSEFAQVLESIKVGLPTRSELTSRNQTDFGVQQSAIEACDRFCQALTRASAFTPAPLAAGEFLMLVRDKLLTFDVRGVGDQLRSLQVLSIAEARYVPFAFAVILGCAEGSFPRALPKDHLIDNFLKGRIGLPGWQLLEAIEDTTFHLLKARLPHLVLLYPKRQGVEPVVRSRFIESLLSSGEATEQATDGKGEALITYLHKSRTQSDAAILAQRSLAARLTPVGTYEGDAEDLRSSISATALEQLISCPYRFLLARLGVRDTALPDSEDARAEGDFLHEVLEAFFTGRASGRVICEPLAADTPWSRFRGYALQRLEALTAQLAPAHLREAPIILQLRYRSWPAFIDHLMRIYDGKDLSRLGLGFRELALGEHAPYKAAIGVDGKGIRINGSIDSIDRPADDLHVLTDYKRKAPPDRSLVRQGLAPQLLLYAAALTQIESQITDQAVPHLALSNAVAGYWNILRGEWTLAAAGSAALTKGKAMGLASTRETHTLEEGVQNLLDIWTFRSREVFGINGAVFKPDASHCGFCRFAGVCRRDDPAFASAFAEQRLADTLRRMPSNQAASSANRSEDVG